MTLLRCIAKDQVGALRVDPIDAATLQKANRIVQDVREQGDTALRRYAEAFGDITPEAPLIYTRAALQQATRSIPQDDLALLQRTCARISAFAQAQRQPLQPLTIDVPGGKAGHTIAPMQRAGCYAPGGRFPLPSSVLMTVATARAAGVPSV